MWGINVARSTLIVVVRTAEVVDIVLVVVDWEAWGEGCEGEVGEVVERGVGARTRLRKRL